MIRRWSITVASACALLLALTACDAGTGGPTELKRPSSVSPAFARLLTDASGNTYELMTPRAPIAVQEASAWIGNNGGTLFLPSSDKRRLSHGIVVPPGTVQRPTLFTIKNSGPTEISVELTAHVEAGRGRLNNVGAQGFQKRIYLLLSYADADIAPEIVSQLRILYVPQDGAPAVPVRTLAAAGVGDYVLGELDHFSKYAMAMD